MNIDELRRALEEDGISPRDYRIAEQPAESTLCLEVRRRLWLVYYFERGKRRGLKRFRSEEDACASFYRQMHGQPG